MTSRSSRQARILALVESREVSSQSELADLLAAEDISVSQGTLSKDLLEIGAVRIRGSKGNLVYAPPGAGTGLDAQAAETKLARLCQEVLLGADASANIAVLRTPPGAAQYFASAIDRVQWHEVLGCIAGDDTVLLISREADGGEELAARFMQLGGSDPLDAS
ncbi:arginine repressor [Luteococcus peritonei]|uniref:Arginine repressor n=1 Tax=Luteococcus peritonei TaxID=88874 RepID=A0ABW4RY67_9ACTN